MQKSAITKKLFLDASGILEIDENGIYLENTDNGELIDLRYLLYEFADKSVKLSCVCDYDYGTNEE